MQFKRDGICCLSDVFSDNDVDCVSHEIDKVVSTRPAGLVFEATSSAPRALQGPHLTSTILTRLASDRRLLVPAMALLNGPVYVHQYKVNFKQAFVGDLWPWHQDFAYWHRLDGLPRPDLVTAMIALDEVTEFNGPLFFILGSHRYGLIQDERGSDRDAVEDVNRSFSSRLPFQLDISQIGKMLVGSNLVAPKGGRGLLVFFAANVAHASLPNLTPYCRRLLLITYNRTDNRPIGERSPRPGYVAGDSYEALEEIRDFATSAGE